MERTTVYLSSDLRRELEDAARRERRPKAELVREALQQYLNRQGRPRPSFVGSMEQTDVRSEDAKAWVRGEWASGRRE
jgi:hypothetical protein